MLTRNDSLAVRFPRLSNRFDRRDEWLSYTKSIQPSYDAIARLVGQVGGLMIAGASGTAFEVYLQIPRSLRDQLAEAKSSLSGVVVPAIAMDHYRHLLRAVSELGDLVKDMDRRIMNSGHLAATQDDILKRLQHLVSLLKCTADPWHGLQHVSFNGACACGCEIQKGY